MIRNTYNALNDEVYDEKFLKPLLLSVDYTLSEPIGLSYIPMDKNIHIDHIIPRKYKNNRKEWGYLKEQSESIDKFINTLGNMALLYSKKNEAARNFGMPTKIDIYSGKDHLMTGATTFHTTREVVNMVKDDTPEPYWDLSRIEERKKWLISLIEKMLDISTNDVEESPLIDEWNDASRSGQD